MALLNREAELRSAWRSLGSLTQSDGWRVIPVGGASRTLAGVRFPTGEEALLVGFSVGPIRNADLPNGRGFGVEKLREPATANFTEWIAVLRRPAASLDLFALMSADLLASVNGSATGNAGDTELRLFHQFLARIRSWQRFMARPKDQRLTDDEEVGLFGELTMISMLLEAGNSPSAVVDLWKGPMNALRDFPGDQVDVEVKSTIAVNGFPARIGSLEQLDDADGKIIKLAAFRFVLHELGLSLPALIASISDRLDAAALPHFQRRLDLARYSDLAAQYYVRKFALADERVFDVAGDFPRLARSATTLPVRDAEYELDLDLVQQQAGSVKDLIQSISGL